MKQAYQKNKKIFMHPSTSSENFQTFEITNLLPEVGNDEFIKTILDGLLSPRKYISSIFFYDELGSKLFKEITNLPEYYIPKLEMQLIKETASNLQKSLKGVDIIEFGCGDCSKISIILDAISKEDLASIRYIPIDISRNSVVETANILSQRYANLRIHGILADFIQQLDLITYRERKIFCFFGSTIGNLYPDQRVEFCSKISNIMQNDDILLLGVDMVKDRKILNNAYNDSLKITERFNKNILNVINNLVGTTFNPNYFEHVAFFNEKDSRIEMHLKATENIETYSPYSNKVIRIKRGETIHTENSYKFTYDHIKHLSEYANLTIDQIFTDKDSWFSLVKFGKSS
ncbi:MAG: L-histidine N(alpha)-methyltransferase [Candidatus Cloacimonetes bacterium]|nr:L-histidine N(alpha)-methyltransferase [Candidatus Cloacimonadota bacterium]